MHSSLEPEFVCFAPNGLIGPLGPYAYLRWAEGFDLTAALAARDRLQKLPAVQAVFWYHCEGGMHFTIHVRPPETSMSLEAARQYALDLGCKLEAALFTEETA